MLIFCTAFIIVTIVSGICMLGMDLTKINEKIDKLLKEKDKQ